ncbi:M48 family metalloprotease [candidate division KSB1 bacterium]|nr:M48 family metalloprotease [candidate division KSB1 bacterium]
MQQTKIFKSLIIAVLLIFSGNLTECSSHRNQSSLAFITVDEEMALGKELTTQTLQSLPILRNQEINEFFNRVCQQIGVVSEWEGMTYKLFIVNQPDINHFSLPGGSIFIFRGVIEDAETVSEIAAVIAHEVAHIANRDGVARVGAKYGYAFAAQRVLGTYPEIAKQIVRNLYSPEGTILDYPKDSELDADERAVRYAWKANFEPSSYIKYLERVRDMTQATADMVALLALTHPSPTDRMNRARSELDKIPFKSSLIENIPIYDEIKEKLARIPI